MLHNEKSSSSPLNSDLCVLCPACYAFIHLDVQPCSEQFHAGNVCFPAATSPNQKERAAIKPSSSEAWESHRDLHPVTVAGVSCGWRHPSVVAQLVA